MKNRLRLVTALTLLCLVLQNVAHAQQFKHRMVRFRARQSPSSSSSHSTSQQIATDVDPGMQLTEDSDADESLQHDEAMRLMMRTKAESVIASHAGTSFTSEEVENILSGTLPSVHPGLLTNVSWTLDVFESGTTLPTTSSFSSSTLQLMSTDEPAPNRAATSSNDPSQGNVVNVDDLLHSFFHADAVKTVFDKVQAQSNQKLDKQTKKQLIKHTAPVLHKTIEKVASHRGWGVQDARFAQMHLEEQQQQHQPGQPGPEAFKDYNTFVKTMRSALITPTDATWDSEEEQDEGSRTDPDHKA
ncbi:glucan 1,3 beta-glucosidase [Pseudozyma hubeiensis SY62]|uniref:Glucan 1,3 beta-glucosidase n=1 Tax=Pseudozyma hubeiensis (strain SY62) TaxID=1305764 RepID=R9P4Q4_PSEHS|nr:glucan 1,3 beta-glucosidase [Pseudozyma hubeiensis SY62]GAC96227.1 glucan 1,3 beta-glucosidase [Pseudozyma hubeiensis SY62]